MRETKFRVWCEFEVDGTLHKEMAGPENWFLLTQTGHLMSHGPMSFDTTAEQKHKKLIPMFWTGLHDKNGKDCYFGDIVRHNNSDIGIIEWDEGRCGVRFSWPHTKYDTKSYPISSADYVDFEVIGNIHENPELLTAETPKL